MARNIHICNKEPELSQMKSKIDQIHEDVAIIKYALKGNGSIGLIQKVEEIDQYTTETRAQVNLLKWVAGSGIVMGFIGFIFYLFGIKL